MPQSLSLLLVHVAFSTKNREPFLAAPDLRAEMHACLASIFAAQGSPAVIVGGVADHVHVLCSLGRTCCIADVVKEAKRASTLLFKERHKEMAAFHWQTGYGAFSVSYSRVNQVRDYIANQPARHDRSGFQPEFRALLRRHGVPFDERYVWD